MKKYNEVYGPSDDNYGRYKPFWKKEKENCVSCACETPYTKNTHITLREYYIEGAGQLCKKCYDQIYNKK